jgi:transposase
MVGRPRDFLLSLSEEQHVLLRGLVEKGEHKARTIRRANILLLSDGGQRTNAEIAATLQTTSTTVRTVQRRFLEEGLEAALSERERSGRPKTWTVRDDVQLTAIACSTPPEGRARWTLRLLRDRFVVLSEAHDTISHERIRESLKKTALNPGKTSDG